MKTKLSEMKNKCIHGINRLDIADKMNVEFKKIPIVILNETEKSGKKYEQSTDLFGTPSNLVYM